MNTPAAIPTKSPDAGHAHAPAPAHHFDDWTQHVTAATLGMWLFLVTELMFFGGLILVYAVYRRAEPAAFAAASRHLDVTLGTINTVLLLTSSFTMALSVWAAHYRRQRTIILALLATALLGAAFVGIKAVEYAHKFEEGHAPLFGRPFHWEGEDASGAMLFYGAYFAMTGVHALHMIIGIGAILILAVMAARGRFKDGNYLPIEMTGLYWHFVDIVWIFLFPLLYLIAPSFAGH